MKTGQDSCMCTQFPALGTTCQPGTFSTGQWAGTYTPGLLRVPWFSPQGRVPAPGPGWCTAFGSQVLDPRGSAAFSDSPGSGGLDSREECWSHVLQSKPPLESVWYFPRSHTGTMGSGEEGGRSRMPWSRHRTEGPRWVRGAPMPVEHRCWVWPPCRGSGQVPPAEVPLPPPSALSSGRRPQCAAPPEESGFTLPLIEGRGPTYIIWDSPRRRFISSPSNMDSWQTRSTGIIRKKNSDVVVNLLLVCSMYILYAFLTMIMFLKWPF